MTIYVKSAVNPQALRTLEGSPYRQQRLRNPYNERPHETSAIFTQDTQVPLYSPDSLIIILTGSPSFPSHLDSEE